MAWIKAIGKRVAFLIGLALLVTACRTEPIASPSTGTPSTTASDRSQPAAESPTSPRASDASAIATPATADDATGRELLRAMVGDAPMEIAGLKYDESIGEMWDGVIAERLAEQIDVDPSALQVTAAHPLPGRESELPDGWTIVALEHPNGHPIDVLGAYLAERLIRPRVETAVVDRLDDDRDLVLGSNFSLAWTDTALFIMGYEPVAALTNPEADTAQAEAVTVAVYEATAALPLSEGSQQPRPPPATPDDAGPTPQPDRAMEMALPASAGGEPLTITSFASVRDQDPDGLDAGLFGHLLPHFEQPGTDAALGFASSDASPVLLVAHRLTGHTGDQLLAAALGELWGNPDGNQLYRSDEVDGKRYLYHQDWAFYAQGDILYFLLYYGGYECSQASCTFGPDPDIAETVRDLVRAIPEASDADR